MTVSELNRKNVDNDITRRYLRERAQWWNEWRASQGKLPMTFEQARRRMLFLARSNLSLVEHVA
jgi:hypothetical protein